WQGVALGLGAGPGRPPAWASGPRPEGGARVLRHNDLIARMTLEEKIRLCSGASYWTTEAMPRHGIRSIFLSDGPHGLRKQVTERVDHLGANASLPATCFPTASAVASTWDLDLIRQMGEALGAEAVLQDVNVLLGPGV